MAYAAQLIAAPFGESSLHIAVTGFIAVVLAVLHLQFPRIEPRLDAFSRRWTSFVGGMAGGYVFLSLLPKLTLLADKVYEKRADATIGDVYLSIYLSALAGFLVYMLLDRRSRNPDQVALAGRVVLGLGFTVYAFLMGYVVGEANTSRFGVVLLVLLCLGAHGLGFDHHLRKLYPAAFDGFLRYALALAVVVGWQASLLDRVPDLVEIEGTAFLSGAVLVNVMSEELPNEEPGQFAAFFAGAMVIATIALIQALLLT